MGHLPRLLGAAAPAEGALGAILGKTYLIREWICCFCFVYVVCALCAEQRGALVRCASSILRYV